MNQIFLRKCVVVGFIFLLISPPSYSESASLSDVQQQAVAAFKLGQFSRAADLYGSILGPQSNDVDFYRDYMWACWKANRVQDTLRIGEKILKLKPDDIETENLLSKVYQSLGQGEKAVVALEKVVAADPNNNFARFSLIRTHIQLGNLKKAEVYLREMETEVSSSPSVQKKLQEHWKSLARAYVDAGQQDKAVQIYQQMLGRNVNNVQVQVALARIQTGQKKYVEAERTLKGILKTSPDLGPIYPKLANVQFLKGDYPASIENWTLAIEAFPEKTEYKFKRAQTLYFDQQFDVATQELINLMGDPEWGRRAADFLFDDALARGDPRQATKIMEDSLATFEYEADDQKRLIRLSNVYEDMGEFSKSWDTLNRALEFWPADGSALSSKVSILLEQNKYREAARFLRRLVQRNPSGSNWLYSLSDAYDGYGAHKYELATIRKYRTFDPTNPTLLLREAEILFSLDRKKEAKTLLLGWLKENGNSQVLPIFLYHGLTPHQRDVMLAHTQHHTADVFEDHIKSLKLAGYTSVTVRQVNDWLLKGVPLPDRPVLITFDDGRLDGFRNADPILAKYRMSATMFVIGQNTDRNLPNYANWNELRALKATGRWDLQAHSDRGHSYIPITKFGHKGLFLINKQWIETKNRLETRQEWIDRINADYERGKRKMLEELKEEPIGFAFPEGNYGQVDVPNAKFSNEINMASVRNYFGLAFSQDRDRFGLNLRSRDPYYLSRVEPPQSWNGDDLIRHISDNNPANRARRVLMKWAEWDDDLEEANYWMGELKAAGASAYMLGMEQAALEASHGSVSRAKKMQDEAKKGLGRAHPAQDFYDAVHSEKRPSYNAMGRYFIDQSNRRSWAFEQGLTSGKVDRYRFSINQRLGEYKETGVPNVAEHGWGGGVAASLGNTHSLRLLGMQHAFDGPMNDQFSAVVGLNSRWTKNIRTDVEADRSPLFFAKALHAEIRQRIGRLNVMYTGDDKWDFGVNANGTYFSDDNERWYGQFDAAYAPGETKTFRLVYRLDGLTNKDPSPFYYSPKSLVESTLGISQSIRVISNCKLSVMYLPGFGQEYGASVDFVQNFLAALDYHWKDKVTFNVEFNYMQNPTYYSRGGTARLGYRFGSSVVANKIPEGGVASPEAPQPDMRDSQPF